ncbi:MAG: hypothetical protein FJ030_14255 [Chloroflexi bacterium]|nr:hypothetical protein [Chloroflexota bacterium]
MHSNPPTTQPPNHLTTFFLLAFAALALAAGYWTLIARDSLIARADNPRALIAFDRIQRGRILDRSGLPLAETLGQPGDYTRRYEPSAAHVVGYSSFRYGLSGIEAAADSILTGLDGQDEVSLWWHHHLLGEPRIGRDVQLTLDIELQRAAFDALGDRAGAIVILDAISGGVLAMASSPTFDPSRIDSDFETFTADSNGPLLNRATLGLYAADPLLDLFPETLDLAITPALPIPTQPADGNRITPLHMALLTAAIANDGLMPAPRLTQTPTQTPNSAHPIAIISSTRAAEIRSGMGAGYAATAPTEFDDRTIGWFIGLTPSGARAICVVIEDGVAAEAAATALPLLKDEE